MDYVKVPLSRIGALIGPKGETKKKIENLSGCEIKIDSNEGLIEIISKNKDDPLKNLQLIAFELLTLFLTKYYLIPNDL